MPALNTFSDPKPLVAVVVPVYKHPVLLGEAVHSVLAQGAPFPIVMILVNDGCPFPETARVCAAYALSEPSVYYLEKPNGSMSSARNFGVDFALARFPSVEAIYFLDADNRLTPNALSDAFELLDGSDADWVYPNLDKFGLEWNGNYSPRYSKLIHANFDNICDTGSLVARRVFEAGVRFDETMKSGFEDWDFWLQAIERGFRGRNHPYFGFEYRHRAESMNRDSDRDRSAIMTYLRDKHRGIFSGATQLAWEHEEAPRYAAFETDFSGITLFTDPTVPVAKIDFEQFTHEYIAALIEPESHSVPPFLLWLSERDRRSLQRLGLISNVLWLMEGALAHAHFASLRFKRSFDEIEVTAKPVTSENNNLLSVVNGWMTDLGRFRSCVEHPLDDWVKSLRGPTPDPRVVDVVVRAPFSPRELSSAAITPTGSLLGTIGLIRDAQITPKRWNWRSAYLPARSSLYKYVRSTAQTQAIMPRLRPTGRLQIGMALPIARFGGAEKVAYAVSRIMKDLRVDVHLFVFGEPRIAISRKSALPFASINFLASPTFKPWGGARQFMGHELSLEDDPDAHSKEILGFLFGLDIVINCHVAGLNPTLGKLKRGGTKIVGYLHVIDRTFFERDAGHPYLALAFEHVYDLFLTCSEQLSAWLHGMGVPESKIINVPNAPGYDIPADKLQALRAGRSELAVGQLLRALFLGRLDHQKGLERLHLIVQETARLQIPVRWRIVGGEIVSVGAADRWRKRFERLGLLIENPIYDPAVLSAAFLDADVVVLPSRWEGAPLTVLEAQRLGCIPLCTDVGAVSELITHGQDGYLVGDGNDASIAHRMVELIRSIAAAPRGLEKLRTTAMRRSDGRNWRQSLTTFVHTLQKWFPNVRFDAN